MENLSDDVIEDNVMIAIGLPYPVPSGVAEGCHFNWTRAGLQLLVMMHDPSNNEIENVSNGPCWFALSKAHESTAVWFLSRFGKLAWMDAPYSIHCIEPITNQPVLEGILPTEQSRFLLQVLLVDLDTTLVKAFRIVTLTTEISRKLTSLVAHQLTTDWEGKANYGHSIGVVFGKYRTKDLVMRAMIKTRP